MLDVLVHVITMGDVKKHLLSWQVQLQFVGGDSSEDNDDDMLGHVGSHEHLSFS